MLSIVMLIYDINPVIKMLTDRATAKVRQNTFDYELVIVYNGKSTFQISADKEISFPRRVGIAEAYNAGFKVSEGDYLCCLHNDTEVSGGWAEPLIEIAKNGDIGFPVVNESQSRPELRGFHPTADWMPPGCCFVMSRILYEKLGGYDEQFKELHWEDADLFLRAQQSGARLLRGDCEVLHHKAATRTFLPDKGEAALLNNRALWVIKHQDGKAGLFYPQMEN